VWHTVGGTDPCDVVWLCCCDCVFVLDLFCGQLQSRVQCGVCQRSTLCFDAFMDISLSLPKVYLTPHLTISRVGEGARILHA
jgi:ubiquitin C-terminal hydrolase